jgi:hypothetical protein
MKVYLMHRKGFKERLNNFMEHIMQCSFVDDLEIIMFEDSQIQFSTMKEKEILPDDFPKVEINRGNRSLIHKQFRAFKKIADSGEPAMILEDDVIFNPPELDNFVKNFNQIPADWEFCFFGTCCGLKVDGQGFVKNNNRLKSKCTDSMVIHPNAANKIYEDMKNTRAYLPIDWDLNYRFIKLNTNVYWYEPGFITQGSQNGKYESEIQGKP